MDLIQHKGFAYFFDPEVCRDCAGFCCRGRSGNVWINAKEIEQIARFLKTNQFDIIGKYLNPVDNRLSIKERYVDGHYECVFFDEQAQQCSIYPARPDQCRRFPFWTYYRDHFEELVDECPGVRLNV